MGSTMLGDIYPSVDAIGGSPFLFGNWSRDMVEESRNFLFGRQKYRIGLFVPLSGSAGIWGPSSIASAEVAIAELNNTCGIRDLEVELVLVDAAFENNDELYFRTNELIETGQIQAIVGMHISAVRQKLVKVVAGRVPYVYTALYEGGETAPGVYTIGETPECQLGPAIQSLTERHRIHNWALIGNEYVWPRASHAYAKRYIKALGGNVTMESYLQIGKSVNYRLIEQLSQSNADGLLLSLVGQDAIDFNRAFGELGLDRKMVRLSCAIEENGLLAIGSDNLKRLYSSASYFSTLNTAANNSFKERYYNLHGMRAPMLNFIGQSLYEGVHFLSSLTENTPEEEDGLRLSPSIPLRYRSARNATYVNNRRNSLPIYLARADGYSFSLVDNLL